MNRAELLKELQACAEEFISKSERHRNLASFMEIVKKLKNYIDISDVRFKSPDVIADVVYARHCSVDEDESDITVFRDTYRSVMGRDNNKPLSKEDIKLIESTLDKLQLVEELEK